MKLTLQRITIFFHITVTACTPSPELLAAQTATASTAIAAQWTKTSTATLTPTLTHTPKPTATKTLQPTPTLFPRKQVLIEAGWRFGDGIPTDRIFFGPFFVLYTDGELLIMSQRDDRWYSQTTLTSPQMCDLLSTIKNKGFFSIKGDGSQHYKDPIYSFPITSEPWMVMGGGGWYITVNGRPAKYVYVYHPYQQYLAAEIKSTYSLLYSYTPPSQMKPYRVKYLELLVIKGMRQFEHLSTPVAFLNWPSNLLPPKEVLADDNIKAIIIDDKGIDPVLDVFGIPPMKILFTYQQEAYTINTTPLLPHQPHDHPSTIYPQEFDLPFKCP